MGKGYMILLMCLVGSIQLANAQSESVTEDYAALPLIELTTESTTNAGYMNPNTGMMTGGGSFTSFYFKTEHQEEFASIGSGGASLEEYLADVPDAQSALAKYRGKKHGSVALFVAGGVAVGASILSGSEKVSEGGYNYNTGELEDAKYELTSGAKTGVAIGVGAAIIGAIVGSTATKHLKNAVSIYNNTIKEARRDSPNESADQTTSSVAISITPNVSLQSAGLGLKVSF